jgi:hypothetical protein
MVQNVEERVPGSHSFSFTGNVYWGGGEMKAFIFKPHSGEFSMNFGLWLPNDTFCGPEA